MIADPWYRQLNKLIEFDLQLDVLEDKLKEHCNRDYNIELFPLLFKPMNTPDENQKYSDVEKFLLEQMEGESDDDHLTRVKTIKEFWEHKENDEGIAA